MNALVSHTGRIVSVVVALAVVAVLLGNSQSQTGQQGP